MKDNSKKKNLIFAAALQQLQVNECTQHLLLATAFFLAAWQQHQLSHYDYVALWQKFNRNIIPQQTAKKIAEKAKASQKALC